jgi:hypothetical protein
MLSFTVMRVVLLQARNEAYFLPTMLGHLRDFVDGFVALDDGSTDDTQSLLATEPKMLDVLTNPRRPDETGWDEGANRSRLVARAQELGARWALACDPDERFELRFLELLGEVTKKLAADGKARAALRVRDLWNDPLVYRTDGVWGNKGKYVLFRVPAGRLSFTNMRRLHGPWYPAELSDPVVATGIDFNVYHLKSARERDRRARRARHERLDPTGAFQTIGYSYLTDETTLWTERIPAARRYDLRFVPADLLDDARP